MAWAISRGSRRRTRAVRVAGEPSDRSAQTQLPTVRGVQVAEHRSDLFAEHAMQRHRHRVNHGDLGVVGAGGGGDLAADPTGTDDHHAGAWKKP